MEELTTAGSVVDENINSTDNTSNTKNIEEKKSFNIPDFLLDLGSEYYNFTPLDEGSLQINMEGENPFASIPRSDRLLGKLADWTLNISKLAAGTTGRRKSVAETVDEEPIDEWSLVMVESKYGQHPSSSGTTGGNRRPGARNIKKNPAGFKRPSHLSKNAYRIPREPSVTISSDWALIEEIEFARLAKLSFIPSADPLIINSNATASNKDMRPFDKNLERILSVKNEKLIGNLDITPTPSIFAKDDKELIRLAKEHGAKIATTDVAITALMACSRSILPWDISSYELEGVVVIDKSSFSISSSDILDFPAIYENADEPPVNDKEHINGSINLAVEAARINAKISSFVADNAADNNTINRYVLWDLGDDLKIIIRCKVNYYDSSKQSFGIIKSLLEYEPGKLGDWRSRLDTQRAAIVANEAKNNAAILSRWLFEAILANVEIFKIAFVSRINSKDRTKHALLGLQEAEPFDHATQLGIDISNGFGILKALSKQLVELILIKESKSIILLKDPNKPLIRLYSCPLTTIIKAD